MSDTTLAEAAWRLGFGDLPVDEGIALREGTTWRHFPAPDPARYAGLLSIADLDAFLRTDAARTPRISMADGGRKGSAAVPPEEFIEEGGARVDLPRLLGRFDAGATLVVSQFHELHAPLARFCRGLEKAFLHGVQANIYLTPPGAQGFRVHFDTHDVLVMQIAGRKSWRVWDRLPFAAPTRLTPWANSHEPEGDPHDVLMAPGDALYLPRGAMHDAAAQRGEASLHVTVGLLEPSMGEMLRNLIDTLEAGDASFRASVPSWRLGEPDGVAAVQARLGPLLARLGAPDVAERLAMATLDRVAQDRLSLAGRGLMTPPPGPEERLRLADAMHHHLVPLPEGGAALRWYGGVQRLSADELGWLMAIEEGAAPGALGEDALAFARRLGALGLLERG